MAPKNRSKGYRARKDVREEVDALRAKLAKTHSHEWRKATCILENIAQLLGHTAGPNGSAIIPRSCRFCGYYGHSRQNCERQKAHDRLRDLKACEQMLREDAELRAGIGPIDKRAYDPRIHGQAETFTGHSMPTRYRSASGSQ